MNANQRTIINALKAAGADKPQTADELAERVGWPRNNVINCIAMMKAGQVAREVSAENRYVYRLAMHQVRVPNAYGELKRNGKIEWQAMNEAAAVLEANRHEVKELIASAQAGFAAALGVPETVLQCTYIATQIDSVITALDRPPRAVLAGLVAAANELRNAGVLLAKEYTTSGVSHGT
jgi:hypothetical protein